MAYGFMIEMWGDRALFTRPEFSVERMSYDVITPSAARGIIESVFWHPGLVYRIDRIHVLNPIRFTNVRRNEVKSKALGSSLRSAASGTAPLPYINTREDIQQRASTILTGVHYVVEAHFDMTDKAVEADNPGKFCEMLKRRLRKGQCYSQPYFGTREFPAFVKEWNPNKPVSVCEENRGERDLGFMLYDMDYSDPRNIVPMFYRAVMRDGVIDVAGSEVHR